MKPLFDLQYNPPAWTPADQKNQASFSRNYSLDPALDKNAWESMMALEAMQNGQAPMPSQQDLSRTIASEQQPQQVQNSVKQSVSMSGAIPQGNEDYFKMMKDAQDKNQANVNGWIQDQNNLTGLLAGQDSQMDISPLLALSDAWTGHNISKGYKGPQSQEEKLAIVQQLKNGILKAQQGLSDDEINMLKTKYAAMQDEKWKKANFGLEKEKLDILKNKAGKPGTLSKADQADRQNLIKTKQAENTERIVNLLDAAKNYESLLDKYGYQITGANRTQLESAYKDLSIKYKEAAKLGALTGPDMNLIEGVINPTTGVMASITGNTIRGGKEGAQKALGQLRENLKNDASLNMQTLRYAFPGEATKSLLDGYQRRLNTGLDEIDSAVEAPVGNHPAMKYRK